MAFLKKKTPHRYHFEIIPTRCGAFEPVHLAIVGCSIPTSDGCQQPHFFQGHQDQPAADAEPYIFNLHLSYGLVQLHANVLAAAVETPGGYLL